MSNIYQDVLEGVDPLDALDKHMTNLNLPVEYEDVLYKRASDFIDASRADFVGVVKTAEYPAAPPELIKQLTDNPVPLPADEPPTPSTVTAAGSKRPMVAANYSKMSDDELLSNYESAKLTYQEQLKIDPDGKAFMPTARGAVEGYERELAKRGIDPNNISSSMPEARVSSEAEPPKSRLRGAGYEAAKEKLDAEKAAKTSSGPLKVGEVTDLPTVHSAKSTGEKLKTTARVADAVSSDGGAARIASEAAEVVTDAVDVAATTVRSGSRAASSAPVSAGVAKAVTKGHAGAIALGVAAAGLLLGRGMTNNKRADRSAAMNAQQRYGR